MGTSNDIDFALKKLEFLNLEFTEKNEVKINNNNYSFNCRFKEKHNHSLHSDNIHLNAITDLVINLGYNLQKESIRKQAILEKILDIKHKEIEERRLIITNIDYIKEQNNQIIKELKEVRKNKEKITNVGEINSDIDKITEAINKLSIEDLKINRKPKPYKHWSPRK